MIGSLRRHRRWWVLLTALISLGAAQDARGEVAASKSVLLLYAEARPIPAVVQADSGFNGRFELWVTGTLSPKARHELQARGFTVVEQAGGRFDILD